MTTMVIKMMMRIMMKMQLLLHIFIILIGIIVLVLMTTATNITFINITAMIINITATFIESCNAILSNTTLRSITKTTTTITISTINHHFKYAFTMKLIIQHDLH